MKCVLCFWPRVTLLYVSISEGASTDVSDSLVLPGYSRIVQESPQLPLLFFAQLGLLA